MLQKYWPKFLGHFPPLFSGSGFYFQFFNFHQQTSLGSLGYWLSSPLVPPIPPPFISPRHPISFSPFFFSSFFLFSSFLLFSNTDPSFYRLSRYSGADLPTPENGGKFENRDFLGFHNSSYGGDPRAEQRSYGDPDDLDEDEDDDQDWMNRKSKITFEVEDEEEIDREVRKI